MTPTILRQHPAARAVVGGGGIVAAVAPAFVIEMSSPSHALVPIWVGWGLASLLVAWRLQAMRVELFEVHLVVHGLVTSSKVRRSQVLGVHMAGAILVRAKDWPQGRPVRVRCFERLVPIPLIAAYDEKQMTAISAWVNES